MKITITIEIPIALIEDQEKTNEDKALIVAEIFKAEAQEQVKKKLDKMER